MDDWLGATSDPVRKRSLLGLTGGIKERLLRIWGSRRANMLVWQLELTQTSAQLLVRVSVELAFCHLSCNQGEKR